MSLMKEAMDALVSATIFVAKVVLAVIVAGVSIVVIIVKAANR